MLGSVVNLLSSPPVVVDAATSDTTPAAAVARRPAGDNTARSSSSSSISRARNRKAATKAPQEELSLVPIDATFPRDRLHKNAKVDGPPTIRLARLERGLTLARIMELIRTMEFKSKVIAPQKLEDRRFVILGRNEGCMIEAGYLSRKLVTIHLEQRHSPSGGDEQQPPPPRIVLTMLKSMSDASQHRVQLNGDPLELDMGETCELVPGNTLALFGDEYKYVVHWGPPKPLMVVDLTGDDIGQVAAKGAGAVISAAATGDSYAANGSEKANFNAREESSEQSSSPLSSAQARKELGDDFSCPLCFEILVKAKMLSCGHGVCGSCAVQYNLDKVGAESQASQRHTPAGSSSSADIFHTAKEQHSESSSSSTQYMPPKCPQCRETVTSAVPSVIVDNAVWNNVLLGNVFSDLSDVKTYLSRVDRKLTVAQAKHVLRNDKEYLSEYLATLAPSTSEDGGPRKKARSETSTTRSDNVTLSNDVEDDGDECIVDLNESSQGGVICVD